MILRNVAGQPILIGPLLALADGSAATSGAAIAVRKDGVDVGTPAGALAHVAGGVYQYTPSQGETDAGIVGLILSAAGAAAVGLNVLTTRLPVQVAGALPAVAAGSAGGLPTTTAWTDQLAANLAGDYAPGAQAAARAALGADLWAASNRTLTGFSFPVDVGTFGGVSGSVEAFLADYTDEALAEGAAALAGAVWSAEGRTITAFGFNVTLAPGGLDQVAIDGVNARQALAICYAGTVGVVTGPGAQTGTGNFVVTVGGATRITGTMAGDARTAVAVQPPN